MIEGKIQAGWWNFCQDCGGRYWVRAVDLGQARSRRYVSDESDARHECLAAVEGARP